MATILLVHANSDDREMYAEYLRIHGLDVIEAGTTDEALTRLADCQLMITGLLVPGSIDCVQLVARTRAQFPTLPIVVLTACVIPAKREAALAAGCDVFLLKPCFPETLLENVWELLDRGAKDRGTPLDGTTR